VTKTKKMLILLGVFVVLVGAYVLVSSLNAPPPTGDPFAPEDDPKEPAYTVFALNADQLNCFVSSFGGASYAYHLSEDAQTWFWNDDKTLPLSNSEITLMMSQVVALTSALRYENVADEKLPDYGLDDDAQRVEFRYRDGTGETLIFGKKNVYANGTYCALASAPSTVYVIDSAIPSAFAVQPSAIVEDDKLPTYTASRFSGFLLTWQGTTYTAEYAYPEQDQEDATDEKQFTLYVGGQTRVLSAEDGAALVAELRGWKLKDAVTFDSALHAEYNVSDENENTLCVYYTYDVKYEDEKTGTTNTVPMQGMYKLYLGNVKEDGSIYVRLSDANGVYLLSMPELMAQTVQQEQ
jgi:hypothetical protein